MPIHEKLRKLRLGKNMSQLTIADQLHISQNAYSLIENGKTKIDEQRILQLSKILDIHPFELLDNKAAGLHFYDKVKNGDADNKELITQLITQINRKDEQIDKLLLQIQWLSQLSDLSKK